MLADRESGTQVAGVSHIDVANLDREKADYIQTYCAERGIEISAWLIIPILSNRIRKREKYISIIC